MSIENRINDLFDKVFENKKVIIGAVGKLLKTQDGTIQQYGLKISVAIRQIVLEIQKLQLEVSTNDEELKTLARDSIESTKKLISTDEKMLSLFINKID